VKVLRSWLLRFADLFHKRRRDGELADEIDSHLQMHVEENLQRGMTPAEARRQALIKLGGVEQMKEEYRARRGLPLLETLAQDIRFALRMLRKSPGFAMVAVLTLALGIGANTAIFSLVDWLILRPLPVAHPSQVVFLEGAWKDRSPGTGFSYPDFQRIQEQTTDIFAGVAALQMFQMDGFSIGGKSEPMWASYVSGNFFSLLGIKPALGRLILPSEGKAAGADPVLVISYSFWKSRLGADPSVVGKKVLVNGHPMTIVGVAAKDFHGPEASLDLQGYMPMGMAVTMQDAGKDFFFDTQNSSMALIERLKDGVSLAQANAALPSVGQNLSVPNHGEMTLLALPLEPASLVTGPEVRPALNLVSSLFLILAIAVLILACMNIANLCLVRVAARQREVAMRAALGATRGRLIRQLLTESLLLALLGCVGGMILGVAANRAFGSIPLRSSLPFVLDFHFDWRVFAYALGAAALTGILVGITPALRVSRTDLNEILHEGGRTSTAGRQRFRNTLVAAQVAGSLMLLIVAGLFVRSMQNARHVDLGFDPSHVLNATIDPHEAGYQEAQGREFQKALLMRARSLPGVVSASVAMFVPMGYDNGYNHLKIDGYEPHPGEQAPAAGFNAVSVGYLETMGISLLQGRDFQDSDGENSQRVAMVNENFVNLYWRGQNPIGRHFSALNDMAHAIEVVGVVKNSRDADIFTNNDPFYYVPITQYYGSNVTLQVKTISQPAALAPEVVMLIHSLEPAMPVFDVQTMTTELDGLNGFLLFQLAAVLAGSLGFLGLVLALVGVYGVISYAASQRTHEIGIRMALGAQPAQILKMILRYGLTIVGIGVVGGVLAAGAMARVVGNFLFGVPPFDPLTYASATLLLAAIALLACYVPARRAMRVDPMVALRYE
jgi:predicted permease